MKILAVDASTNVAGCAVLSEQKLIAEDLVNYKLKHSEKLMPAISSVMDSSGLDYGDLDVLAVTAGPGSFTGLRIGIAAVKGICQASGKKVIPVSTLKALAYNLLYTTGLICPLLDARRSQVYTAVFRSDGSGKLKRLSPDATMDPGDLDRLLDTLVQDGERVYLLGDGMPVYGQLLTENKPDRTAVKPFQSLGHAASVAACAQDHPEQAVDFHVLEPVYLRPSYAEEKKK